MALIDALMNSLLGTSEKGCVCTAEFSTSASDKAMRSGDPACGREAEGCEDSVLYVDVGNFA